MVNGGDVRADPIEVVSFDVWDTLLRRRCDPESVKLFTCRAAGLLYGDLLSERYQDPWSLFALRAAVERELAGAARAEGFDGEYLLLDVCRRLVERAARFGKIEKSIRDQAAARLMCVELAQEAFVCEPNPEITSIVAANRDRRLVFLSDFHLSAADLGGLLKTAGLADIAGTGFVSGEVRLNKKTGRLFTFARESLGVSGGWLHIGDDEIADVAVPRKLGIDVAHFASPTANAHRREFATLFGRPRRAIRRALRRIDAPAGASSLERLGVSAAPLFVGFALWTLEQALRHRSERVFFCLGEGAFFARIYDAVAGVFADVLDPVPTQVLAVSRLSTFGPTLANLDASGLAGVWAMYRPQSPRGLFATLGLDHIFDPSEMSRFSISSDEEVADPATDSRLVALFGDPVLNARIRAVLEANRDRLERYVTSVGMTRDLSRATIVDIGWRGSIQDSLARMRPQTKFQGLYLGLERRPPSMDNVTKHGYGVDLARSTRHANLVSYVAPMEFLCDDTSAGSTIGYDDADPPQPVQRDLTEASRAAHRDVVRPFQAGVEAVAEHLARELRTHSLGGDDLRPLAVAAWRDLVLRPHPEIAKAFAHAELDETFGFGRTSGLSTEVSVSGLARNLRGPRSLTKAALDVVRSIPWPHAYPAYTSQRGLARYLLPTAVRVVRTLKRAKAQIIAPPR